jgi:hypothetical protein
LAFLLNITDPQARFVVYVRRTLPPTPTTYDFRRIVTAEHLHYRSTRRNKRAGLSEEVEVRNGLITLELEPGNWYFGFLNDDIESLEVGLTSITAADEESAGCKFDCFGKGSCNNNKCACYPGYSGTSCQESKFNYSNINTAIFSCLPDLLFWEWSLQ